MFLELDAKAALTLELEASANGTVVVDNGASYGNASASADASGYGNATSTDASGYANATSTEASVYESATSSAYESTAVSSAASAYESASASSEAAAVSESAAASSQYSYASATTDASSAAETASASYGDYTDNAEESDGYATDYAADLYSSYKRSSVPALVYAARAAERRNLLSTVDKRNVTTDGDATFGGCFTVSAGFNVNVGAQGSFFGIFDQSVSKTLFGKDFQIFQVCYVCFVKNVNAELGCRNALGTRQEDLY